MIGTPEFRRVKYVTQRRANTEATVKKAIIETEEKNNCNGAIRYKNKYVCQLYILSNSLTGNCKSALQNSFGDFPARDRASRSPTSGKVASPLSYMFSMRLTGSKLSICPVYHRFWDAYVQKMLSIKMKKAKIIFSVFFIYLFSAVANNQRPIGSLNLFTNKVENVLGAKIIEPYKIKSQALSSATEVATMILRIDDVL